MSLAQKRWGDPLPAASAEAAALAEELGILPALARVLLRRGIKSAGAARAFLYPSQEQLHSPWLMKGMEAAVERICAALERGEKIVVHGDYDVDGITAAALLVEALRELGAAAVDFFLPSRFREGYGLHREALEQIAAGGARLVITVDCGINAAAEIACARSLGLDLVVTDHHQPFGELQGAAAVLNPLQKGCPYPFKELSGAGIAFKLACALMERAGAPFPADLLDLAALGTAADVVPLLGENRVLVACGLEQLRRAPRLGLLALARAAGLAQEHISSYALAFILAPPLNAAGRLGEADPALALLLEREEAEAERLALLLHRTNRQRREVEMQILEEAEAMLAADRRAAGEKVIVLAGEGWPHGVIGIVASRLVERHCRPAVLVALEGDEGRGSARSIPGFDITAALDRCASLLERFGGHAAAAGFTIAPARVGELREALNRYAAPLLPEEKLRPFLELDTLLEPHEISLELARQLQLLEPFGTGNPRPLFCSAGWELKSWRLVGETQEHLKLNLACGEYRADPIFFRGAPLASALGRGRRFDLAFSLREGSYLGQPVAEMVLKDLRSADSGSCGRVTVIDRRGAADRRTLLKEILSSVEGEPAAVFAGTGSRAAALKRLLPPPAVQRVAFLSSGGDNYNGEREAALLARCRVLVLYDLPLSGKLLEPFFQNCPAGEAIHIWLLYGESDLERNRLLLDLGLPSRSALVETYRAWCEAASGSTGPALPGPPGGSFSPGASRKFWQRCLKIYAEAGLCRGEAPSPPAGGVLESAFEHSPSFRRALALRESCCRYQEFLLGASPEELAAHWKELLER
ncbi:MAG: single-stranded-DNA-specific exonuclease RecJ [Dethiobacteria bacterium]